MDWNFFKDKVALVTGSSRGIGNAIAHKFALSGADVVVNYRKAGGKSQEQGDLLCKEIREMGRRAYLLQADISVKDSVKNLFQDIRQQCGRLDFLILNAARAPFKPLERLLERELRQLIDTNYLGNIFCVQEALPLLENTGGKVVFISSLGSRFYNPAYPLGTMKAAMESSVRDLAESLHDRKISVNAVCGGIVMTDSFKVLRQYWEEIDQMPEELFVQPDEIADAVLFLCDPASKAIRGQTIVVDRGLSNRLYRPLFKKK
ncbi:MAG: SDR family oxidoreductase [Thermodesulfovibrionales bacterium]|jgi:NAD(P)-dependent dehydrogenase (short-subunit alcohol dehydrogenase family)